MKSINEGHERVSLVVYPEGTTSRGNILLPFKHGAFGAMVPLQPLLMVLEYSYINASFDAFPWKWWAVLSCCSPASLRLIAYWLPAIQPPAAEDTASKGEHERVREYTAISNHVMREAIIKLNPNVDMGHLQKPHVVVLPAWRNKLLARLYGPAMQRYYKISDEEMRKTEEVVFH
ncbi:-Lysophospholipid acyltransferase LPCAT4 [Babesia bigemina]|uniref:-Lysophospholipid acyltransferase LPCAT4 n=1 Tax=Babesia bigemina TaxID=5866 RepID=A0A061DCX3_BABBI|nr:-Lysophospholipid acyltransferase LPCAT4 [Babesia bigemina]CDR98062.1 -Lysophospholipid acyltransferase LPCAT4 [Babesia bigemina]|eukprot:XP_012770248.1 -Lysophospholipid acyltransferase LPCAT4 [Babesia bigemina]